MILLKIYWHMKAIIKVLFYKAIFMNKLKWHRTATFRDRFNMAILGEGKVRVSRGVFFNNDCSIACMDSITIEEGSHFGENVRMYDHNHCYGDLTRTIKEQGFSTAPIVIGKNCWIGTNSVILKGVTIGDYCVVGAGCVVFKDLPSKSVLLSSGIVKSL